MLLLLLLIVTFSFSSSYKEGFKKPEDALDPNDKNNPDLLVRDCSTYTNCGDCTKNHPQHVDSSLDLQCSWCPTNNICLAEKKVNSHTCPPGGDMIAISDSSSCQNIPMESSMSQANVSMESSMSQASAPIGSSMKVPNPYQPSMDSDGSMDTLSLHASWKPMKSRTQGLPGMKSCIKSCVNQAFTGSGN